MIFIELPYCQPHTTRPRPWWQPDPTLRKPTSTICPLTSTCTPYHAHTHIQHMHTHAHTCMDIHAQCIKYQNAMIWMIMWHIAPYLSTKYTLQRWPRSWPVPHLFKPKSPGIYFAPHWKILRPAFPLSALFFAYIFQINFLNQLII